MPKAPRDYLLTEGETRVLFIMGGVGAVAALVLILVLISARPQGQYTPADTTQYQQTLTTAAAAIGNYSRNETTGRITIPIEQAMELVAERGVTNIQYGNVTGDAEADPVAPSAEPETGDPAGAGENAGSATGGGTGGQGQ